MSASVPTVSPPTDDACPTEEDLRKELRIVLQKLKKREPQDLTYKRLLMNGILTSRRPVLPKGKLYKRIGSGLRARIEKYVEDNRGKTPWDRIAHRQPLEDKRMCEALTLREAKDHEQQPLLEATLAALPRRNGMDEMSCRRHLEAIAMGLQGRGQVPPRSLTPTAAEQTEQARLQAGHDNKKAEAMAQEKARMQRERDERMQREADAAKRKRAADSPQQALYEVYSPIFQMLWDMDFYYLNHSNPFRLVIDRENCAAMGAPDYFDVVETPMNLTYIKAKAEARDYETLAEFDVDVNLMLDNAIKYNSHPDNPYRKGAEEMRKEYLSKIKKVVAAVKKKQKQQK